MNQTVSFLTVIYREDISLVARCFKSLLAQTLSDFKVIVVLNDPNRKDVLELIKTLGTDKFVVHAMKENVGLTRALNVGLNLVEEEFVARIDPDDYCLPERLEKQVTFMKQNPDYVLVGCAYDEISEGHFVPAGVNFVSGDQYLRDSLRSFNPFAHSSLLLKSDTLKKMGGYNPAIKYAQDYDLICRLSQLGKIENLTAKLVVREKSLNQVSVTKRREQLYYSMLIRYRFITNAGPSLKSVFSLGKSFVSYLIPNSIYAKIKN
jgi:glycosyltransferase involved in cell wall biosynthesis